jgi:hypothetical protein
VFADDGITEEDLHTGGYGNYESLVQVILSCGTAGLAVYVGEQSTPPG